MFQPVLALGGYAGWGFLKRTMPSQQAALQATSANQRDDAYFRDRIGKINSADDLVSDRRLLRISLAAFGLEGDLNNKAFIRKVLQDGTLKTDALANRLADKQYLKLSSAFGFGDFGTPRNKVSDFADKILGQYRARQFETAVGEQNSSYRLALNAEREIPAIASRTISEDGKWYTVLGSAPLRQLMQTALGLPSSFASIDLDQQVTTLKKRTEAAFGSSSVGQFSDPAKMDALVRRYLLRADLNLGSGSASPASIALQLLQR